MCFAFSLIFSIFAAKNYTFPIGEQKKQQTAKGLLLKIGVSYFFYGLCFLYILISTDLYFLQYGFQSSDEVIHILLG